MHFFVWFCGCIYYLQMGLVRKSQEMHLLGGGGGGI
jgi:hypothetical protein